MGAGGDDHAVQLIDEIGGFRSRTRGNLEDCRQAVLLVAWIDALGTVADIEILVEAQPGFALDDRHADLFGRARVDRGLVDHHVALRYHLGDGAAGLFQRRQVRVLEFVDGCRHGDDIDIRIGGILEPRGVAQVLGPAQLLVADFQRGIMPRLEFPDSLGVDVIADGFQLAAKLGRQRQADIAQPQYADAQIFSRNHGFLRVSKR